MTYLIIQTFILLLIAALLGLVLGWYLTRMAAASLRASLQTRVKNAEADARALRTELDDAVNARGTCEAERKQLAEALAELQAAAGDAETEMLVKLRAELDACRAQLSDASVQSDPPQVAPLMDAAVVGEAAAPDGEPAAPPRTAPDDGRADDLQQIKGIGPKIATILNELGIVRFEQIAAWTPQNIAWINDHLRFKGRVEREKWIPQARALADTRDAAD